MNEAFGVLNDQNANADESARAFVLFERREISLTEEADRVRTRLLGLQQQLLVGAGQDIAKALKAAKAELEDLVLQAEACRDAQERIKSRLGNRILEEKKARVDRIEKEWQALEGERIPLFREYLSQAAKAAVLFEQIDGPERYYYGAELRIRTPNPQLDLQLLDRQDFAFYEQEVLKARKGVTPMPGIRERQRALSEENHRVEREIESFNMEEAVKSLLRTAGSRQFPEPVPPEPRMTPHIPRGNPLQYPTEPFRDPEEAQRAAAGQKSPAHPENSLGFRAH